MILNLHSDQLVVHMFSNHRASAERCGAEMVAENEDAVDSLLWEKTVFELGRKGVKNRNVPFGLESIGGASIVA